MWPHLYPQAGQRWRVWVPSAAFIIPSCRRKKWDLERHRVGRGDSQKCHKHFSMLTLSCCTWKRPWPSSSLSRPSADPKGPRGQGEKERGAGHLLPRAPDSPAPGSLCHSPGCCLGLSLALFVLTFQSSLRDFPTPMCLRDPGGGFQPQPGCCLLSVPLA